MAFGKRARVARSAFLVALITALLLVNAVATGVVDAPAAVPEAVEDRSWNMFGNPPQVDGWYVGNATLTDGGQITARIDAARLDRPPDDGARYPNARWRKYQGNLAGKNDERLYAPLAEDACRRWTATGDQSIQQIRLEHRQEQTNLSGPDRATTTVVGQYDCHRAGAIGS